MLKVIFFFLIVKLLAIGITTQSRYIKVKAYNLGAIPEWHPGTGRTGWIFIDEIVVE